MGSTVIFTEGVLKRSLSCLSEFFSARDDRSAPLPSCFVPCGRPGRVTTHKPGRAGGFGGIRGLRRKESSSNTTLHHTTPQEEKGHASVVCQRPLCVLFTEFLFWGFHDKSSRVPCIRFQGEKRGQGLPPVEGGGGGQEATLPSKRRRTNVDYVALQKKLQVKAEG